MVKYVYTNAIGCFVFDNSTLLEERLFGTEDVVKMHKLFVQGEIIPVEEELKEKYKNAKVIERTEFASLNILATFDDERYLKLFREANILITKKDVSESLTSDQLIIQAVNSIDEIDKASNMLARRLREWYELHNPEFSRSIENHEKFAELIIEKDKKELLSEIKIDPQFSMGADICETDLESIRFLAKQIISLAELKTKQSEYIEKSMEEQMPNIKAVAGFMIGAKLVSIARSLQKMMLFPASTIQLLGAEKALFRHIKTGARSPKYGILINHPVVMQAKPKDKGKAARMLADKLSIAAKIDYFKGDFKGFELLEDVKKKLGQN